MTFYISSFRSEREAPSLPHCDTVFPVSLCQTYDAIPQTKKIPPLRPPGVTGAPLFSERLRTDMRNKPFSRFVIPSAAEESLLHYGNQHVCTEERRCPLPHMRQWAFCDRDFSATLSMTIRESLLSPSLLVS